MTHAEICPVCKGKGRIPENYPVPYCDTPSKKLKVCHGCGGNGWIEVSDPQQYYIDPQYPWWPHYPQTTTWTAPTGEQIIITTNVSLKGGEE